MSLYQKRFLIVWCIFHSFALATNLIPIDYHYDNQSYGQNYLFTNGDPYNSYLGFWPFVEYNKTYYGFGIDTYTHTHTHTDAKQFLGIFFNYNISSFIVYILLGFAIVFIPKLWGNSKVTSH